jgi:hypothetical protein
MTKHEAAWARELIARYNSPSLINLSDEDWARAMDEDLRGWTNQEVIAALRWSQSQACTEKWKVANVNDLVVMVRTYRKRQRERATTANADLHPCNKCRAGWIDYWPEWEAPYITDAPVGTPITVPCHCVMGRKAASDYLATLPNLNRDASIAAWRTMSDIAHRQFDAMERNNKHAEPAREPGCDEE